MTRSHLAYGLVLAGLASGCTSAQDSSSPSLCPSCAPQAGGETSDFSGDVSCLPGDLQPLDRAGAVAEEFQLAAVLEWLEQPMELPLRWKRRAGGTAVEGYDPQTRLRVELQVEDVQHGRWLPVSRDVPQERCTGDFLRLELEVRLRTDDGALSGSFRSPARLARGADAVVLRANGVETSPQPLPLGDFHGGLKLGIDGERPHVGELHVFMSLGRDFKHGTILPVVRYADMEGEFKQSYTPIEASFPDQPCPGPSVDPDETRDDLGGQSLRSLFDGTRAAITRASPVYAEREDGSEVELDVELGTLQASCRNPHTSKVRYDAVVEVSVRVQDLLSATESGTWSVFAHPEGTASGVGIDTEYLPVSRLLDRISLEGVDTAHVEEARFGFYWQIDEFDLQEGVVEVDAVGGKGNSLLRLQWCLAEGADRCTDLTTE